MTRTQVLLSRENIIVARPVIEGFAGFSLSFSGLLGKDGVENKSLAVLGLSAALGALALRRAEKTNPANTGGERIRTVVSGSLSSLVNLSCVNNFASD